MMVENTDTPQLSDENIVHGYLQETVTQFLEATAAERASLEATIEAAQERQVRARATLGSHRVMSAMLLDAEREIATRRRRTQRRVEEILRIGEREAQLIRTAPGSVSTVEAEEFHWTP